MRKATLARAALLFVILFGNYPVDTLAHEVRPAYLGITEISERVFEISWKQPGSDRRRSRQSLVLPKNCVDTTTVTEELVSDAIVRTRQVRCSETALREDALAIRGLADSLTDVWVNVRRLDDSKNLTAILNGANTKVWLESGRDRPLLSYLTLGLQHLWSGFDHLLLIVGLMFFVRGIPALIKTVTAFTVAHSISLALSAADLVRLSSNPVEAAIALSVLYLAFEASRPDTASTPVARHPWMVAFAIGLLHGLGFAGGLKAIGLPTDHAAEALLLFNIGIEIGQIALLVVIVTVQRSLSGFITSHALWLQRVPVYTVGIVSSFWVMERIALTVSN